MTESVDLPVAGTAVLLRTAPTGFEVLMMRRPDRGSFPGAWVFPGGKVESSDRREGADECEDASRAAVRETREEVGLVIETPIVLSRWQPPIEAPVRIRTWFFVAVAGDDDPRLAPDEVVAAVWLTPAAALRKHAQGEWTLFPPTWVTLDQLSRLDDVAAVLASAGVPRRFSTSVVQTEHGTAFDWDGLRLETGSLPWRLVER